MTDTYIDGALYDAAVAEYERSYVLADKPVDLKAIGLKAVEVCRALPKLSPCDVAPLFVIARRIFAPIPQTRHLSDSIPMLNAEREAHALKRPLLTNSRSAPLAGKEKDAWFRWLGKMRIAAMENRIKPYKEGDFKYDPDLDKVIYVGGKQNWNEENIS